jgi:PAS domain S-box-containing protein
MRSEDKLKGVTDLAPAITYTLDKNGKFTYINPVAEKVTGISIKKLLGKSLSELICPDNRASTMQSIEKMRTNGEIVSLEADIITKGPDTFVAEIKEKTITANDGTIESIGVIRDITERYYLEKQKDLWVGIATHELKTPLTSIKAFAQILEHKAASSKNGEYENYLKKIGSLTDKMATLINDLLDVTKINSGTLEMIVKEFDLSNLVKETVEDIRPTTHTHKITFELIDRIILTADRQRIAQVINNLLSNAVKYSPEGTEVVVRTKIDRNSAVLSVQDSGVGIAKDTINHIFELFYRGGSKLQHKSSGLGLGLFISQAIVSAHNGKIWVESKVGKGSTFYVQIPINTQQKKQP